MIEWFPGAKEKAKEKPKEKDEASSFFSLQGHACVSVVSLHERRADCKLNILQSLPCAASYV